MLRIVFGIIIKDKKILCQDHIKIGKIAFPGGKINHNEPPEDAIERELREELGIQVTFLESLGCYVIDDLIIDYFFIHNYRGRIINREPFKHKELLWMNHYDIPEIRAEHVDYFLKCVLPYNRVIRDKVRGV